MKAGIFDSGIGGLSVLKSIKDAKIFDEIIYYADSARVPYGSKDIDTIKSFCVDNLHFLERFNPDIIIIACNTASAYACELLKSKTDIKIYGVIDAGVLACQNSVKKLENILILGTKATIQSGIYENKLQKLGFLNTKSVKTPLFVPIVEENLIKTPILDATFDFYFKNIDAPDAIILGCTHFPFLQNEIEKYFIKKREKQKIISDKKIKLIHSGQAIVSMLMDELNLKPIQNESKISFYASSDVENLQKIAKIYLK